MADPQVRYEEVQQLADAMFDRQMNTARLSRLEELITSDIGCLQAYVERINFHGGLRKQSIEAAPLRQVSSAMDRMLTAHRTDAHRRTRRFIAATAAGVLVLLGVIGWMASHRYSLPQGIGTIANLTADVQFESGSPELGNVVREGGLLSLTNGIATLQLPNVTLDILAPAKVRLTGPKNVELLSGAIHAHVRPGGEGFSVHTQDSVIVDLGTEFTAEFDPEKGTEVNVRRGRVQASLLDRNRQPVKRIDITTERSAVFSVQENTAREVDFTPEKFERIDNARGVIISIDGTLRTLPEPPLSFLSKQLETKDHMLIIPERQRVVLENELQLLTVSGPVRIPSGSVISSYLIHYDLGHFTTRAPRGAVTFDGQIAAILASTEQLISTDSLLGLPDVDYEQAHFRGLELQEDDIRLSDDRKTVSFYLGASGQQPLDQARVLVISNGE